MDGREQRVIRLQEVELPTVGDNDEKFEPLLAGKVLLLQVFHCNCSGHTINGIYFLDAFEFQETQASNCEVRMEDINHITWAVSKTASFRILHRVSSDDTLVDSEASTPDSAEYM